MIKKSTSYYSFRICCSHTHKHTKICPCQSVKSYLASLSLSLWHQNPMTLTQLQLWRNWQKEIGRGGERITRNNQQRIQEKQESRVIFFVYKSEGRRKNSLSFISYFHPFIILLCFISRDNTNSLIEVLAFFGTCSAMQNKFYKSLTQFIRLQKLRIYGIYNL